MPHLIKTLSSWKKQRLTLQINFKVRLSTSQCKVNLHCSAARKQVFHQLLQQCFTHQLACQTGRWMKARKGILTCCFRGKAVCVLCSLWERQQQETWGCCCCCVEGWPHGNDWSQVTSGHTDSVPARWRVVARKKRRQRALLLLEPFHFVFFPSPPSKSMLRLSPAKQNFTELYKFAKCDDVCCCGGGGASCFWSWLIAEASQVFTGNFVSSFHSSRHTVRWARGTTSHSFFLFCPPRFLLDFVFPPTACWT